MIKRVFETTLVGGESPMYYCTLCSKPFKALHQANEHAKYCGKAVPTQPVFRSYTTAATFELKDDATQFYTNEARTWQGLEAEDLAQIESDEFWQVGNHMAIATAVEAALKKKNT